MKKFLVVIALCNLLHATDKGDSKAAAAEEYEESEPIVKNTITVKAADDNFGIMPVYDNTVIVNTFGTAQWLSVYMKLNKGQSKTISTESIKPNGFEGIPYRPTGFENERAGYEAIEITKPLPFTGLLITDWDRKYYVHLADYADIITPSSIIELYTTSNGLRVRIISDDKEVVVLTIDNGGVISGNEWQLMQEPAAAPSAPQAPTQTGTYDYVEAGARYQEGLQQKN